MANNPYPIKSSTDATGSSHSQKTGASGPPVFGRGHRRAMPASASTPIQSGDRATPSAPAGVNYGRPKFGTRSAGAPPGSLQSGGPSDSSISQVTDAVSWADPSRPAGSGFSQEEWQAARDGGYHVIEIVGCAERSLVRIPIAALASAGTGNELQSLFGQVFDGCMMLRPGAKHPHPGLVRQKAIVVRGSPVSFDVVEPEVMLNEWCRGASFTLESQLPLQQLNIVQLDEPELAVEARRTSPQRSAP